MIHMHMARDVSMLDSWPLNVLVGDQRETIDLNLLRGGGGGQIGVSVTFD